MDPSIAPRRGETEAHLRLKRLALLWAQANRYAACAAEVSLPQCRYRADVAAYRSRHRESANKRCPIFAATIATQQPRENACDLSVAAARSSKGTFGFITRLCAPATYFSPNSIRMTSTRSDIEVTDGSSESLRRCRIGFTAERNSSASCAIDARTCSTWWCLTNYFASAKYPPAGASSPKAMAPFVCRENQSGMTMPKKRAFGYCSGSRWPVLVNSIALLPSPGRKS